ncbi:MAG: hypothetical protein NC337_06960 [Roseburia sp.]|nr:hypothetical protein [Roseburia sp.]
MYKRMLEAVLGGLYWLGLRGRYQADRYIFFPEDEGECFRWGMRLLPRYIVQEQLRKPVVIMTGASARNSEIDGGITRLRFRRITDRKMRCLMGWYALRDMSRQWVVVSTRQPYDTGAERLLGINGVTWRDIVYYDIYKFD